MINNVILVGRLAEEPEIKELENGVRVCNVALAVDRSFKNFNGDTDVDFIHCSLWGLIANATVEYCKKGSLVGIKGRLVSNDYPIFAENGEVKTIKTVEVVCERISFLKN